MSDCKRPSEGGPTLSLLEEHATIDKRTVTTGKVRVVTHTESVEETVRAVLKGEEAEVVTVELDQTVSGVNRRGNGPPDRRARGTPWFVTDRGGSARLGEAGLGCAAGASADR
jgi:Domain of unknown function (DUF2382)